MIAWHVLTRDENFAWERPALGAHKRRQLEIQAGMPTHRGGHKGLGGEYSLKAVRDQEEAVAEQSEKVYQRLFSRWSASKRRPWLILFCLDRLQCIPSLGRSA